jgi:hypothetical protein
MLTRSHIRGQLELPPVYTGCHLLYTAERLGCNHTAVRLPLAVRFKGYRRFLPFRSLQYSCWLVCEDLLGLINRIKYDTLT